MKMLIVIFELRYCQLFSPSTYIKEFSSRNLFQENSDLARHTTDFGACIYPAILPCDRDRRVGFQNSIASRSSAQTHKISLWVRSLHPIPALFTRILHGNIEIVSECSRPAILIDFKYLFFPTKPFQLDTK